MSHRRAGTAYGLDSPRDEFDWRTRAACTDNVGLWEATVSQASAQAIHVCLHHCPVLEACTKETERQPPTAMVQAGVAWADKPVHLARPMTHQPLPVGHGDWCVNR